MQNIQNGGQHDIILFGVTESGTGLMQLHNKEKSKKLSSYKSSKK